jgi:hypothetical protein
MALVREYPVNSVAAQRSAAEAVDVSSVPASATGRTKSSPSPAPKRNLKLWSPRAWCRIRWSDEIKAKNLQ